MGLINKVRNAKKAADLSRAKKAIEKQVSICVNGYNS